MERASSVLEAILPRVHRPNRYVGSMGNAVPRDFDAARLKVALALADSYEIGMSHLGLRLLYHILSRRPSTAVEMCFAPWPDVERELRARGGHLTTLESGRPLADFDLLGFSLQYELHYTNLLNMLDLGGIPLFARDRTASHPVVVGGGHAAYDPEPMADFLDAFVIGDGEEIVLRVADVVEAWKTRGAERSDLLEELARLPGVYVPAGYDLVENEQGYRIPVARPGFPERIAAVWVETLAPEFYPERPLVSLPEITHDRLTVEVMRGCTRGCRFCQAGMINRPVRQKPPGQIVRETLDGLRHTGWDEVSLMSLSTTDHTEIVDAVDRLTRDLCGAPVGISLPSTRPGTLPEHLARTLNDSKAGHITLAPEAGTQRMRDVINKGVCEEELLESVTITARQGYTGAKLYFMIGLPGERPEDVIGIVELAKKALAAGRAASPSSRFTITVSVSPHVPKPQTPFQWEAQDPSTLVEEKVRLLRARVKGTAIVLKWRDSETTFLEGVFSRGDRRLGAAVLEAWRRGLRFDGWTEHLRFEEWLEVFRSQGIDPERYLEERRADQRQPWEHIESPVSRDFLLRERDKARRAEVTVDCRIAFCHACGIDDCPDRLSPTGRPAGAIVETAPSRPGPRLEPRRAARTPSSSSLATLARATRFRLRFWKGEALRFLSHLDLLRVWERSLRRSGLPIAYSQGFRPHMKMSFGPPLPVGYTSRAEYFDLEFERPPAADLLETLNPLLPDGLSLDEWRPVLYRTDSLMSALDHADYRVRLNETFHTESGLDPTASGHRILEAIARLDREPTLVVQRRGKGGDRTIDIRPSIASLEPLAEGPGFDCTIRFLPGSQGRPEEILSWIFPAADARLAGLERSGLWKAAGVERLDPFELLNPAAFPNRNGAGEPGSDHAQEDRDQRGAA